MTNCIFDKIVIHENSHTQLLCNFMSRDDEFRNEVLSLFLVPRDATLKVHPQHIRCQVLLPGTGRPDIKIETQELCALIEVKASNRCGLTDNQAIDEDLRGYAAFLKRKNIACKRLVYLVPSDWGPLEQLRSSIRENKQLGDLKPQIVCWEKILAIIEKLQGRDVLVSEYRRFLSDRFGPIGFGEEEIQMLSSKAFPATFLKLIALIEQIENKCRREFTEFTTFREKSPNDCAFYIQTGRKSESLLYFGMWKDFAEQQGSPICYGVMDTWKSAKTFPMICKRNKQSEVRFEEWTLVPITPEALEGENAVEKIWEKLRPILKEVVTLNRKEPPIPMPIRA